MQCFDRGVRQQEDWRTPREPGCDVLTSGHALPTLELLSSIGAEKDCRLVNADLTWAESRFTDMLETSHCPCCGAHGCRSLSTDASTAAGTQPSEARFELKVAQHCDDCRATLRTRRRRAATRRPLPARTCRRRPGTTAAPSAAPTWQRAAPPTPPQQPRRCSLICLDARYQVVAAQPACTAMLLSCIVCALHVFRC